MSTYVNRTHDSVASAFVRWETVTPDTAGTSYPGPGVFGVTALDHVVESVINTTGADFRNDFITGEVVVGVDLVLTGTLATVPSDGQSVLIVYNRQVMSQGQDFTLSGTAITWLAGTGTAPDLAAPDTLFIYYVLNTDLGSGAGGGAGPVFEYTGLLAAAFAASAFDILKVNPSGGGFPITFPVAPILDDRIKYVNTTLSTNTVILDGNGNNINGAATKSMSFAQQFAEFSFDGTEWFQTG